MRSRLFRLALGVLGLAIVVWAGTWSWSAGSVTFVTYANGDCVRETRRLDPPREFGPLVVSLGVVGLALVAFAAWPRRSTPRSPTVA